MNYQLTSQVADLKVSAVKELLKLTQSDEVISFAGGLPAEDFFPADALRQAFDDVFASGNKALQYGLTEGYRPLREQISQRLARRDIRIDPDAMLLTTGSQQAI
ncbi:MAG: PLP-dependent aminotransferase family protein, partial [Firmicutes bacterium]|nr:PLP-dependent aminotransferase family protein [Bacillota bacterium]